MSNELNNESSNTERVNNLLEETIRRLYKMSLDSSIPPTETFQKNVYDLSGALSALLSSKTKEGVLPNGLLWNINLVSTVLVVEDADSVVGFQRTYVAPNDLRVVIQFGQRTMELLLKGVVLPTTVLVIDKSVVAGEGYKHLKTLQEIKERCLKYFPDSHFEVNEFPLVDPQFGKRLCESIIGDARNELHHINEEEILNVFTSEYLEKLKILMRVNPELMTEKLRTEFEPKGFKINFVPVIDIDKTQLGVTIHETGHYNVVSFSTETGVLEVARLNKYIYPDKPLGFHY
jgi:hypothetical protein